MPSYKPVTAALRVLDVLAAVNQLGARATVAELHRRTGIDKATTIRMLETLAHAGYLVRAPEQSIYQVTGKALSLSTGFDQHTAVGAIIAPIMVEFRQHIGWPSDVALFDVDAMLVVKSSRQNEPFSFNRAPGFRAPVLGTSLGLAWLAHYPAPARSALLERLANDKSPWARLAQDSTRLERLLQTVRTQGYACMDEHYSRMEYDGRVGSIGVPVMTPRKLFAAINVIYLNSALTPETAHDTLLKPLQNVAARMAQEFENTDTAGVILPVM